MPAGTSWSRYMTFFVVALTTMFAGAQCVHVVYRPLDDLDKYIEEEEIKIKQG
ncbi:uncharacterized protein LOC108744716 [Agrilus planipennis]|uniref:Uncharacterized protein LOC108744716 n=1 Tax=Agrilus planipennis TaxID=224129 RepID=A0A1W4XUH1_AGRPL|nr:uncharacterized protein LOC108744716 [Agrilus planipennis]